MTFPIYPVPDPQDDNFEDPGCVECCGTGVVKLWVRIRGEGYDVQEYRCDCQREEEDG